MQHLRKLADVLQESIGTLTDDSGPPKTALRQAIDDALGDLPEAQQQIVLALISSMAPAKR